MTYRAILPDITGLWIIKVKPPSHISLKIGDIVELTDVLVDGFDWWYDMTEQHRLAEPIVRIAKQKQYEAKWTKLSNLEKIYEY